MSTSTNDETDYWRSIRYQPLSTVEFSSTEELLRFRKLLGWSLYCDPVITEHVIDQQYSFLDSALSQIHDNTPINAATRILEIGCGPGYKIEKLASRWGFDAFACDISDEVITFNRSNSPNIHWFVHNANFAIPDNLGKFDIVYTSMMLQHLENRASALALIRECLNESGYLLLIEESYEIFRRRSSRTPDIHYRELIKEAGFDLILEKKLLRMALPLAAFDYPVVDRDLYPFTTYRSDYAPQTLKTKLIRICGRVTCGIDRFLSRHEMLVNYFEALLRHIYPSIEIGMICRKHSR